MQDTTRKYRYLHPEAILTTLHRIESEGTQLVFTCPRCAETASFSTLKRVGKCFVCQTILKLHTTYDGMSVEQLFPTLQLTGTATTHGEHPQADRVEIVTRPLSQAAYDYITARGIDPPTVERFGRLTETTYHDGLYLAWQTYKGDYELRATFPTEHGKVTPRGHHKHVSLARLTPDTTTCIVCEGMFSALAYAQLFPRDDVWYVILNSVSNCGKLVEVLETWTTLGITTMCLALDNDSAGRETATRLQEVLQQAGLQVTCHFPPHEGDDWNDALQRGETYDPCPTPGATAVRVTVPPTAPMVTDALPVRRLDVAYYEEVLTQHGKVVVAAPCGTGKTTTAADLIAQQWRDGVLYVAERVEQLRAMHGLLLARGVPPEMIGLYAARSPDQQALRQEGLQKPIALLTHARMQTYAPQDYMGFPWHGTLARRRLLIVDESLTPLLILSVPRMFVQGLLNAMGLDFTDTGHLAPDTMDGNIQRIAAELHRHARYPFQRFGIHYLEWTNTMPDVDTIVNIRTYAYYQMLYQVLAGHYLAREGDVDVLIPMAPHLTWFGLFDRILVLDATASLTDFLYQDYPIVTPCPWNYHDVTEAHQVYSDIGDLTKTTIIIYHETFLTELREQIVPALTHFPAPYIVTYKHLHEDVQALMPHPVQHYGATRGSNAYRTCEAAVLLGAYRPPVNFDQLAYLLFGPTYSPYKMAVATWMQELYRTRIREGAPIKLLVLGETQAVDLLRHTVQVPFWPMVRAIGDPDVRESILQKLKSRVEKALLTALYAHQSVDIKTFAREHTNYDTHKVLKAMRGLLHRIPMLAGHVVTDETTIRLIEKPIPRL